MVERKNRSARSGRKNRKVNRKSRGLSRKNRKSSRKNRKVSRKNRKVSRKNRKSRNMSGGGDYSLAQGSQFAGYHSNQHGGAAVVAGAPLDYTGVLDAGLRDSARVGGYDKFFQEASGMSDASPATINVTQPSQSGGRRSSMRKNRKNRSSMRKNRKNRSSMRKNRKNRSSMRKNRKNGCSMRKRRAQRGGQSPVDAPTMLLSRDAAMRAGTGDFSNPLLKH